MLLAFDAALASLEIHANGDELAHIMGMDRDADGNRVTTYPADRSRQVVTIDRPVLVTDHARIGALPPTLRDTLFALYASPIRITRYDGVGIAFDQARFPGVWGPSIDTLLFCRALRSMDLGSVRTAIEIGAGSGFLSKYLLSLAPRLERLVVVDRAPAAAACAREQLADPRCEVIEADGIDVLGRQTWDLVMCNPPYIPRPKSIDDNPYEGIGLLCHLLGRASGHLDRGGRIVTNVSSLCRPQAGRALEEGGAKAVSVDALTVPLKVFNVLNNAQWMEYLSRTAGLEPELRDGYEYWHTITIVAVTAA
ncbi:MAG: methyltransferase [bacterium]